MPTFYMVDGVVHINVPRLRNVLTYKDNFEEIFDDLENILNEEANVKPQLNLSEEGKKMETLKDEDYFDKVISPIIK